MIHPSEILRTNSDEASQFSAPVNRNRKSLDCGISALPCLAKRLNLQRFATAKVFLATFALLGLLEGALLSYFRGTSHLWTEHYYLNDSAFDWLLHLNEIFVGVFAIIITYWGDKIHRASWFGGVVMLHAVACIILVVPEVYEPHVDDVMNKTDVNYLCGKSLNLQQSRESNYVALGILVVFQLLLALATIVFYTLGITYLDDNIEKGNAPIYLIIPMATKISGKQLGMYLSWIPTLTNNARVFITGMWLVLSCLIFIFGFIIVMFPYSLPSMVVQRAVTSLLNLANRSSENNGIDDGDDDDDEDEDEESRKSNQFWSTFSRLATNPVLVVNSLAMVFMSTALVNFEIYQNIFYQLRFFVNVGRDLSGYHDPFLSQIIMNIIKYPFIATSLIAAGLIVAKTQPTAKQLAIFNVGIYVVAALSYVSFIFSRCDDRIKSEFDNMHTIPYCSSNCVCKNIPFTPICTTQENMTYFSPCHAGCQTVETIRDLQIYGNCTCGANIFQKTNVVAVDGSCNKDTCDLYWAFAQISSVMVSSILATTTVTNLMINLRCVLPSDKPMALALETTLLGILPYIPGKLVYSLVADSMCKVRGEEKCLFHSESFGVFFSIATVVLMALSAILAFVVIFLIGKLHIYDDEETPKSDDVSLEDFEESENINNTTRRQIVDSPSPTNLANEEEDLMNNRHDLEDLEFSVRNLEENPPLHSNSTNAVVHNEAKDNKKSSSEMLESDF